VAGITQRRDEQEARAAMHATDLRSRTWLLAATGQSAHDELAAAKADLGALAALEARSWSADGVALLARTRAAVDRVSRLIDDLRDLSRLHAGVLETYLRPVDLDEVMTAALDDLGPGGQQITLDAAADLPDVIADAALLARILTSLLADALVRSPADAPPTLTAASLDGRAEIRIADQGPDPGDGPDSLAFRLARDLADATGDTLRCEHAPGGGRTVTMALRAVARRSPAGATRAPVPYDKGADTRLLAVTQAARSG
jgi:two-component system, OmpR family, sensor histidine kinase KdpD